MEPWGTQKFKRKWIRLNVVLDLQELTALCQVTLKPGPGGSGDADFLEFHK